MEDLQSYIILFLVSLASTIVVRIIISRYRTKAHLPPSPTALPIIGHLHLLGPIPHQSFHKLSTRFGPLVHLSLGSVPCLVVSSPEMAKQVLQTHEASFLNRPQLSVLDYMSYPSADFSFGPYGPYWKFMKKLCMSRLLGGKTLDQLLPVRREEIKRFVRVLHEKAEAKESVEIGKELMKLTNNVVSKMSVGQRCSGDDREAEEMANLVKERNKLVVKFNLSDYIWFCRDMDLQGLKRRAMEFHEKFDSLMERVLKEHEEARKKKDHVVERVKDLVDILLDIFEDESSEIRLGRDNIKAFILDIFVAGTGTSALTVEWSLAELINHPEIMNIARKEIDTVIGKNRLVEESDIPNLPYIQAIVKETLRLHPAGPLILRESSENCIVSGYTIRKNTQVYINSWSIGRDPNYWENPLEFKPERFLREEGSEKRPLDVRGQHFQLLPFGSGKRTCPGVSLAFLMIHTTLVVMIQCFDWKVIIDGKHSIVVDMEEAPGLSLARANPLICVPLARLSSFPI